MSPNSDLWIIQHEKVPEDAKDDTVLEVQVNVFHKELLAENWGWVWKVCSLSLK